MIGILSVRNHTYHPNRRLMEAGSRLGHQVMLVDPGKCFPEIRCGQLHLEMDWPKSPLDVLLPRLGATISDYALALVRQFERAAVRVVNGFQSIHVAKNKFLSLQALASNGIPVPDSYHVSNMRNFQSAAAKLGGYPVVAKTTCSRQGAGVILVETPLTADTVIPNLLNIREGLLIQEFVPPRERTDIRAFVLGDRVIAAMELRPRDGEFRSNIHLNGHAKAISLSEELQRLAVQSTKVLGLEISGTDIIIDSSGNPKVLEVNYSPGFRGLEASSGLDIASQIIQYVTRADGGTP